MTICQNLMFCFRDLNFDTILLLKSFILRVSENRLNESQCIPTTLKTFINFNIYTMYVPMVNSLEVGGIFLGGESNCSELGKGRNP